MKHPPNFQWVDLHPQSLRPHTQGEEVALSHHGLHDKVHCWLAAWLAAWLAGWLAGWLVSWPSAASLRERWGKGILSKSLSGSCLPQVPESHRRRVPVVWLSPLAPMSPAGSPVYDLPAAGFSSKSLKNLCKIIIFMFFMIT